MNGLEEVKRKIEDMLTSTAQKSFEVGMRQSGALILIIDEILNAPELNAESLSENTKNLISDAKDLLKYASKDIMATACITQGDINESGFDGRDRVLEGD